MKINLKELEIPTRFKLRCESGAGVGVVCAPSRNGEQISRAGVVIQKSFFFPEATAEEVYYNEDI